MHVFGSSEDHDTVGESTLNQEVESVPVKQRKCRLSPVEQNIYVKWPVGACWIKPEACSNELSMCSNSCAAASFITALDLNDVRESGLHGRSDTELLEGRN